MKSKLYQLVKEELEHMLKETGESRLSVHPFANDLANRRDTAPQEDLYDGISNAVIMEMVSAYSEDQIREIIRFFTKKESQGSQGIGGKFSDKQIEDILFLVYEKVEEMTKAFDPHGDGLKLGSYMPEDREHSQYMDME